MIHIGVGTELKRVLRRCKIEPTPQCNCEARAIIMDEEGPDWCYENLSIIVGWMREEAELRKMPFIELGAKVMVVMAIRWTRQKQRTLRSE